MFWPSNTGGIMIQVDNATTVDNIFVFSDGTNKFKWSHNPKGVYYLSQARIVNGVVADQTVLLQSILNHSSIRTIVLDAQQIITISGSLNANNKTIVFYEGAKFTGNGTISNAIIDADYEQQILDITLTLSGCRVSKGRFSVKWFGAKGDGSNDDQPAIQTCIDTIVANTSLGKDLYFPKGTYRINSPLIISNYDGTRYQFTSVNLIGGEASHFTNTLPEAQIYAAFANAFAIGVQRVRSLVIRGIYIHGAMTPLWNTKSVADYYEGDYATWASQWGVRDSPNSPYAAIVVDPFLMNHGALPPDGGYPTLTSWYKGEDTGGSSGVLIKECRIDNFAVGILNSPATQTQNAENMHIEHIAIENCKVAFATSQRQEKNNTIKSLISWGGVHTILDACSYGQLQGCPPNIDGWNIAGLTVRLFNIQGLQFNLTIKNVYAELLYRIGNVRGGNGMICFEGGYIDFSGVELSTGVKLIPDIHAYLDNVKFDSTNILYYDDLFNKRLAFKGSGNTFVNCRFDKLPMFIDQIDSPKSSNDFINCHTQTEIIGPTAYKGNINTRSIGIIPCGPTKLESAIQNDDYILSQSLHINAGYPDFFRSLVINSYAFTLNESTRVGTFVSNTWYWASIDDYVLAYDLTTLTYVSLGRVSNVDSGTGTITMSEVPWGVDDTHQFYIGYIPKIQKVHTAFYCSATQNLPGLTNVDNDLWAGNSDDLTNAYLRTFDNVYASAGTLQGGAYYLYGDNIYVPNYGTDGDQVVTEYIISIVSPDTYAAAFPTSLLLMKTNTVWVKKPRTSTTTAQTYKFTTGGYLNAAGAGKTRQAVWALI